ncbi:MAG: S1 family peptidase [Myxococcota bacterium]
MNSGRLAASPVLRTVLMSALLVLVALTSACGGGMDWRKQTLQVTAAGYQFDGTQIQQAGWSGSAVWLDNRTILTNAHVAGKALKMEGKDDYGTSYTFDKILSLNEDLDIAVLQVSGQSEVGELKLVERPDDPKSLRGTKVQAIGNTGGQGLSVYSGEVTNVVGEKGAENIVHSADISSGSSGGPLYDMDGNLLGVNKAINLALRQSFATPAWQAKTVVDDARGNAGAALSDAFSPKDLPVSIDVKRDICLEPDQKLVLSAQVVGTADLVAMVKFTTTDTPLFFGLIRGDQLMSKGVLTQDLIAAWTLPGSGVYAVLVVNPPQATTKACASVAMGRLDWKKRISSK